jgi:hypothetical protein
VSLKTWKECVGLPIARYRGVTLIAGQGKGGFDRTGFVYVGGSAWVGGSKHHHYTLWWETAHPRFGAEAHRPGAEGIEDLSIVGNPRRGLILSLPAKAPGFVEARWRQIAVASKP